MGSHEYDVIRQDSSLLIQFIERHILFPTCNYELLLLFIILLCFLSLSLSLNLKWNGRWYENDLACTNVALGSTPTDNFRFWQNFNHLINSQFSIFLHFIPYQQNIVPLILNLSVIFVVCFFFFRIYFLRFHRNMHGCNTLKRCFVLSDLFHALIVWLIEHTPHFNHVLIRRHQHSPFAV